MVSGAGGKAFSAGYDIKEFAGQPKRTPADWRARMQKDIRFTYSVWDCSKPVIAMIDGFCYAGALEFAMCCDMRYCSDASTFAAVEARFSNGIATMVMPWLIGRRCRALIYSGDSFDSGDAFRLGVVDKAFPKATLHRVRSQTAGQRRRKKHAPLGDLSHVVGDRASTAFGAAAPQQANRQNPDRHPDPGGAQRDRSIANTR